MSKLPKGPWEYFCDESYYHQWAVRPIGDRNFGSQYLFHVPSMGEAQALCGLLNELSGVIKKDDKAQDT